MLLYHYSAAHAALRAVQHQDFPIFFVKLPDLCIVINTMGVFKQISEYLYLKKKDPDRPKEKWIGYMHGINRLSLIIFLLCLVILAIKLLF